MVYRSLFLCLFFLKLYGKRTGDECFNFKLCNFLKKTWIDKPFSKTELLSHVNTGLWMRRLTKIVIKLFCESFFCCFKCCWRCRAPPPFGQISEVD